MALALPPPGQGVVGAHVGAQVVAAPSVWGPKSQEEQAILPLRSRGRRCT